MNYQKIYDQIVEKARSENRKKREGIYYENHHIIPRCLDGSNERSNLILLTAREHYVCHKLLFEIYPHNSKLFFAWNMMSNILIKSKRHIISSKEYERIRKLNGEISAIVFKGKFVSEETKQKISAYKLAHPTKLTEEQKEKISERNKGKIISIEHKEKISKFMKGRMIGDKHPMFGKHHTEEAKQKISKLTSGENNPFYGKHHSEEVIERMRGENNPMFGVKHSEEYLKMMSIRNKGQNNPRFGVTLSEETRKKISEKRMGKKLGKRKLTTCPHCNKTGGSPGMKRYHFDNCKFKNQ